MKANYFRVIDNALLLKPLLVSDLKSSTLVEE